MKLDDAGETDDSWSRSVDVCLRRPCDQEIRRVWSEYLLEFCIEFVINIIYIYIYMLKENINFTMSRKLGNRLFFLN